jgi:hypothetical protein
MARFASGQFAIAICDRCGLQYPYRDLKKQWNGFRNCYECWDAKHPQLDPIFPPTEPQALSEPRPSRYEPMDVPVGQEIFPFIDHKSLQGITSVGIVTITTGGP